MTRLLQSLAVLAAAGAVSLASRAAVPEIPLDLRGYGIVSSLSDCIWVKATSRMPWPSRVTPSDALRNYRLIRLAARLNPRNTEPYVFGTVAMCMWKRNDLALRLADEGLKIHPADRRLRAAVLGAVSVFGADLDEALEIVPDLEREGIPHIESPYYFEAHELLAVFKVMKARRLEDEGKTAEALEIWKTLLADYAYNETIARIAPIEIRRLEGR